MDIEQANDANFGKEWRVGEGETVRLMTCRFFRKENAFFVRTTDTGTLAKNTVMTHPDGRVFVVTDSEAVTDRRYKHSLQIKPATPVNLNQWVSD